MYQDSNARAELLFCSLSLFFVAVAVIVCLSSLIFLKQVHVRNHSNENEFDLHENGRAGETHFHMNSFARIKCM